MDETQNPGVPYLKFIIFNQNLSLLDFNNCLFQALLNVSF